jgi:hypothetical protein
LLPPHENHTFLHYVSNLGNLLLFCPYTNKTTVFRNKIYNIIWFTL